MRLWLMVLFAMVMQLALFGCSGESTMPTNQRPTQTRDASLREVSAASQTEVLRVRKKALESCLDLLQTTKGDLQMGGDSRRYALRSLATLRAPEATEVLLKNLDVRDPIGGFNGSRPITIGDWYPAAGALAKIGVPALSSCVSGLARDITDDHCEKLCWIIGEVDGHEVGRYRIELAIRDEKDAKRKANLQEALNVYDAVWEDEKQNMEKPR